MAAKVVLYTHRINQHVIVKQKIGLGRSKGLLSFLALPDIFDPHLGIKFGLSKERFGL